MACLLISVFSYGNIYAQVDAEQVVNIGRNVLSMEDYMLAIQYFNQAIKAKPYLADPYYYRAIAKLSLDDYTGAEADCSLAIARNKFKIEAYKVRGFARQQQGLDSLAIVDYDYGLDYNPNDKYFLFYKAVAQTQCKRYEGADTTFSTLTRIYPKFEEAFAEYARMNMLRGDTIGALDKLERTLRLSKSVVNAYLMRAHIMSEKKEWEKALDDLNRAIRLEPQDPSLYLNRAFLYYNLDNYFGSMSDYNYVLQLDPGNQAATYNRALLLAQVRDYINAVKAFNDVLKQDPDNFHALYNRALIELETGAVKDAERDFKKILSKYSKFYPAYYGVAQARQKAGDIRGALMAAHQGEELVRKYIKNPKANPLDKPMIDSSRSNVKNQSDNRDHSDADNDDESSLQIMEKFNQLITMAPEATLSMNFNEKIKGRVQDRDLMIRPEASYSLSLDPPALTLNQQTAFRELDELNGARYVSDRFYLVPDPKASSDAKRNEQLFQKLSTFDALQKEGKMRPVDYFLRGTIQTMLRNYQAAEADFSVAVELAPDFTLAYFARGFSRERIGRLSEVEDKKESAGQYSKAQLFVNAALKDYDAVLERNPRLAVVWLNKGNIFYDSGDYTSAMNCYAHALETDANFGQAYYNRGLCYLQSGNRTLAFADLSKAGELGVLPSYNLLKRMKTNR